MIKGMFKYKIIRYIFVMNSKSKNMFVTKIMYTISIEEDVQGHYPEFRIWNIYSLMLQLLFDIQLTEDQQIESAVSFNNAI